MLIASYALNEPNLPAASNSRFWVTGALAREDMKHIGGLMGLIVRTLGFNRWRKLGSIGKTMA